MRACPANDSARIQKGSALPPGAHANEMPQIVYEMPRWTMTSCRGEEVTQWDELRFLFHGGGSAMLAGIPSIPSRCGRANLYAASRLDNLREA